MSKVITFSRTFPSHHPKAGQPTYFVEQVLNAIGIQRMSELNLNYYQRDLIELNQKSLDEGKLTVEQIRSFVCSLNLKIDLDKLHTIRSGHRWKSGEKASLRVWSGRPYFDPQIIFTPDQEVKQVGSFEILEDAYGVNWMDIGTSYYYPAPFDMERSIIPTLAKNDGLDVADLLAWFKYPKPFDGQIVCWKEVNYINSK